MIGMATQRAGSTQERKAGGNKPIVEKTLSVATTMSQTKKQCACGGGCPKCNSKKNSSRGILQAKLQVGAPDDVYEQEADRVADEVLATPMHKAIGNITAPRIQRLTSKATEPLRIARANVSQVLSSPGRPLESSLAQDMGQRFDHDFSEVRIHSDIAATESARDINAYAYTVGNDIVFDASKFAPPTREGRHLLAHELTHVIQQSASNEIRADQSNKLFGLSRASPTIIQRQDAGGTDLDAGVPRDTSADSTSEAQDACVQRLGGCTNTRAGGIASSEEIHSYNQRCREETGYTGPDLQPSCPVAPPPTPPPPCHAVMGGREIDHWAGTIFGQEHTYVNFEEGASRWLIEGGPDPARPTITGAWVKPGQWESRGNRVNTNYTSATDCTRVKQALFDATTTYHSMRLPYDPTSGPNSNSFAEQLTFKAGVPPAFNSLWDHQWDYWRSHPRPF